MHSDYSGVGLCTIWSTLTALVFAVDQVTAELDRIKMQARSTVSLCFSLLSEIHSSRREMMWKIQGASIDYAIP